jgi:hypothetical protein
LLGVRDKCYYEEYWNIQDEHFHRGFLIYSLLADSARPPNRPDCHGL